MNVSLTKTQEKYIARRVSTQEYQTASELVREAIRLHMEQSAERKAYLQSLRDGIEEAEKDIAEGRFTEIRSPADARRLLSRIKRTGRARLAAGRKARAA